MNPLTYFIGNQPKKVKWVWSLGQNLGQISPMLWKNKETGIINRLFSNFAWGIHSKARSSGYRNTWEEIEGQNSKKYYIWRKLRTGDNTEKIWVHRFSAKPKTITAGALGEAVSPQGALGDALVKVWVQSPWTIFFLYKIHQNGNC